MLVITYDSGASVSWHVGEKMPKASGLDYDMLDEPNVRHIAQLQADGHELERIRELFGIVVRGARDNYEAYSIPMPNAKVCRWYGDLARTIYLNLYDWKVEQGVKDA